jgi:hypothetical protein
MKRATFCSRATFCVALLCLAVLLHSSAAASAAKLTETAFRSGARPLPSPAEPLRQAPEATRAETLWIFDADFEDMTGDNLGWFSYDRRGSLACEDYWHKDTLFTDSFPHLGDSAWWCGTYDECFKQGQGYGNDWRCVLARDVPLTSWSTGEENVTLEFDQRFAMEKDYDYGYVDVSTDGYTWTTVALYSNGGFPGQVGIPRNWPHAVYGHQSLDLSYWSGIDIRLRFRFESDPSVSSEDQYEAPPRYPLKNGAWQLDNFLLKTQEPATGEWTTRWTDDCESPGDSGWEHEDFPGTNQETAFNRYQYNINLFPLRSDICDDRPFGSWMMAAVDPIESRTVQYENSYLVSPPIDISGLTNIVGQWDFWIDIPSYTGDLCDLYVGSGNDPCDLPYENEDEINGWYGGPAWIKMTDNWDAYAGNDWFQVVWRMWDQNHFTNTRQGGIFLNRQRVGTIVGGRPPSVTEERLYQDWFSCQLAEAANDYASARTLGFDCDVMQLVVWDADVGPSGGLCYLMTQDSVEEDLWTCGAPIAQMDPGTELHYYFEGFDSGMQSVKCPPGAPGEYFEFSILPLGGDVLLVDKEGGYAPGHDGEYGFRTSYYYEASLDILGHTWDRYDKPDYDHGQSPNGPPHEGMDHYETVIWFSGDCDLNQMTISDQIELTGWLDDAMVGSTRNLVLCGNDLVKRVQADFDPYGLLSNYAAVGYVQDDVAEDPLSVCEAAGGSDFLTSPGGCSSIATGCPQKPRFDVIVPVGPDAELALTYEGTSSYGAAVAHTDPTYGYSVVTYGFGVEYMEAAAPPFREGNGILYFVNLLENTLGYMAVPPDTTPTGVDEPVVRNELSAAHPNPLNPSAVISYSLVEGGPVAMRVFSASGKLVRTLLEAEFGPGTRGSVVWDGRNEAGEECASGVYFYRLEAEGFSSTKKMVLLK